MPDYGKIINTSIETTKKYKWLWIYGLVVGAASSGGNFNFPNSSSDSTSSDSTELFKNLPTSTPNPDDVLGAVTSQIADWFGSIQPTSWLLLFLGLLAIVIVGIAISWVLSAWANAGLIGGLKMAHDGKEVTLKNTSPIGFAHVKPLIKLGIVSFFVIMFTIVAAGILAAILIAISTSLGDAGVVINIILALVGIFGGLYLLINFGLAYVYAQRYVVLRGKTALEAWKSGWKLSTKNFFQGIVMGLISTITSTAFGCVVVLVSLIILGIPAAIFAVPMITNKTYTAGFILPLVILVVIFFMVNFLSRAIVVVFSASNWNLLFAEITKTFEKEEKNA